MTPKGSLSFPTQLQLSFVIHKMERDAILPNGERTSVRNKAIREAYNSGETIAEIARRYGLPYDRVHYIVRKP